MFKIYQIILVIMGLLFQNSTLAEDALLESGWVEVENKTDYTLPYKQRRSTHAWYFAVNKELYYPRNYISLLGNEVYQDVYGKNDIEMYNFESGYKFNFILGAISISGGYAQGKILGPPIDGIDRSLGLTKYSVTATYWMDNIFNEPYFVPYGNLQAWVMDIDERSTTDSFDGRTKVGFSYKAGLLLQLNFLDSATAKQALVDWGVDNTYFDIFIIQYENTASAEDPYLESDINYGAGLRLEF